MQSFVPLDRDFASNARVLDNKRVWKQALEGFQIAKALLKLHEEAQSPGTWPNIGWAHHPAVRMWRGSEGALAHYTRTMMGEALRRNVMLDHRTKGRIVDLTLHLQKATGQYARWALPPWWGGDIHFTHRVSLCRKDWAYYGGLFPDVMDTDCAPPDEGGVGYVWPKGVEKIDTIRGSHATTIVMDDLTPVPLRWPFLNRPVVPKEFRLDEKTIEAMQKAFRDVMGEK